MADDILVTISAQIDQLIAGFNEASDQTAETLAQLQTQVNSASDAIESKLSPAADNASKSLEKIGESSEGVGGALESIKGKFDTLFQVTGIAAAYEILNRMAEKMTELTERAMEFRHSAEMFGITTTEVQGLHAAMDELTGSSDRLDRVMLTLQQKMVAAAEKGGPLADKFASLGITMDQLQDPTFGVTKAMEALGEEVNSNRELIGLLGPRAAGVIPLLREMAQNHDLAAEAAKKVNALMPSEIQYLATYGGHLKNVSTEFQNWESRVAIGVIPALKEMEREIRELIADGSNFQPIWDFISDTLKAIVVDAVALGYAFRGAFDIIMNGIRMVIDPIAAMGAALVAVAHGNFSEAKDIIVDAFHHIGDNWKKLNEDYERDATQGESAIFRMRSALAGLDEVSVTAKKIDKSQFDPLPDLSKSKDTYLKALEQLIKDKEKAIKDILKQDEVMLKEEAKIADDNAKIQLDDTVAMLKRKSDVIKEEEKAGTISHQQAYQEQLEVIRDEEAAWNAYYAALLAATATDDVKRHDIEVQANKKYQELLTQRTQLTLSENAKIAKDWDSLSKKMTTTFADGIEKMIGRQMSFSQFMRSIEADMLKNFIHNSVAGVTEFVKNEMIKAQAHKVAKESESQDDQDASQEGLSLGGFTALKKIMNDAYQAASGAFNAVVGIPYVGPVLAPAAAAAAFAAVAAFGGGIASAAGGWEVPSDQLAMVHKNEMILPAPISDGLRSAIGGGSLGGGGGSGVNAHVHVTAIDTQSGMDFIRQHIKTIANGLQRELTKFNPAVRPR